MKTAYFDPRGCDFWPDENYISDVGNYRLVACVMAKNGEPLIIEFGGWQRRETYTTSTGKTSTRIANENALHADGSHVVYTEREGNYYGPDAGTYGVNFEKMLGVDTKNYSYTRADLLRFLSDVTGEQYTEIVFDGAMVDKQIEEIYTPVEKALYGKARAEREKIEAEREKERQSTRARLHARLHQEAAQ